MKVRMKVDVSGSRNGQPWPSRGGVVDVPDDEGAHLCSAGMAVPLMPESEPETAVTPADAQENTDAPNVEEAAVEPEGETRGLTTETAPAAAKKTPTRAAKKSAPAAAK